jgi:hypothetical protein
MFHLDVSKVDLVLHMLQWLYTHVSRGSYVFKRMLHMFRLDVSKVDRVLHDVGGWRRAAYRRAPAPTSRDTPRNLLSSPSTPFPSLHLVVAI